jgi:ABC-2 type transport system permease protein
MTTYLNKLWGGARLAALEQLTYRFNLFSDVAIQPLIVAAVELTLWLAFFQSTGRSELAGFSQDHYLAYAIWAAFVARISANWMYEWNMIDSVETGAVNAVLVRPISFYSFWLGQFLGYKLLTSSFSLAVPLLVCWAMKLPVQIERLPLALLLVLFYLIFVHTIAVIMASMAFFFNRVHHVTVAKNITLWMLGGEFFPLDILPESLREFIIALPFSSAVFRPVGYLTGRLSTEQLGEGFVSIAIGQIILGSVAFVLWRAGRRRYSGTGA